jgi:hypothetical protein
VSNKKVYQTHMYNTNNSRNEYECIYLQTMICSENWLLCTLIFEGSCYPGILLFGIKKASMAHTIYQMIYFSWNNCTWVHMFSKYVTFWKCRVDFLMKLGFWKWFIEIAQKDMFGRNLTKPSFFIINTKLQSSFNCLIASLYIRCR